MDPLGSSIWDDAQDTANQESFLSFGVLSFTSQFPIEGTPSPAPAPPAEGEGWADGLWPKAPASSSVAGVSGTAGAA